VHNGFMSRVFGLMDDVRAQCLAHLLQLRIDMLGYRCIDDPGRVCTLRVRCLDLSKGWR